MHWIFAVTTSHQFKIIWIFNTAKDYYIYYYYPVHLSQPPIHRMQSCRAIKLIHTLDCISLLSSQCQARDLF